MAFISKIIFALVISAAIALASVVSAEVNHAGLCSEAKMPGNSEIYDSVHQRHQAKTQTCQECCKQHGKMFDYSRQGEEMVCSCVTMRTKIDFHRKKL